MMRPARDARATVRLAKVSGIACPSGCDRLGRGPYEAVKSVVYVWMSFFFQAEDGIRDVAVTGVQTCALPISGSDPLRRTWHGLATRCGKNSGEPSFVPRGSQRPA